MLYQVLPVMEDILGETALAEMLNRLTTPTRADQRPQSCVDYALQTNMEIDSFVKVVWKGIFTQSREFPQHEIS